MAPLGLGFAFGREPEHIYGWIDMECDERVCVYKDAVVIVKFGGIEIGERDFDLYAAEGAQFFVDERGNVQAETVRSYIGRRPWN